MAQETMQERERRLERAMGETLLTQEEKERRLEASTGRLTPKPSSAPRYLSAKAKNYTFSSTPPQKPKTLTPTALAEQKKASDQLIEDEAQILQDKIDDTKRQDESYIKAQNTYERERQEAKAQQKKSDYEKAQKEAKRLATIYSQQQQDIRDSRQKGITGTGTRRYAGSLPPQALTPDKYGDMVFYGDRTALFSSQAVDPKYDTYGESNSGYKNASSVPQALSQDDYGVQQEKERVVQQKASGNLKAKEEKAKEKAVKEAQKQIANIEKTLREENKDFGSGYMSPEKIRIELEKTWQSMIGQLSKNDQTRFYKTQNEDLKARGINVPFSEYKLDPLKYDEELNNLTAEGLKQRIRSIDLSRVTTEESEKRSEASSTAGNLVKLTNKQIEDLSPVVYLDSITTKETDQTGKDSKEWKANNILKGLSGIPKDTPNAVVDGTTADSIANANVLATDPDYIPLKWEGSDHVNPAVPSIDPSNDETPFQSRTPAEIKAQTDTSKFPEPDWSLLARMRGSSADQFLSRDQQIDARESSYNSPKDIPLKYHTYETDNGIEKWYKGITGKDVTMGSFGIDSRIKNWGLSPSDYKKAVKLGYVEKWYEGIHEELKKQREIIDKGIKAKETTSGGSILEMSVDAIESLNNNPSLNTITTGTSVIQPVPETTTIKLNEQAKIVPSKVPEYVEAVEKAESILVTSKPLDTSVHDATQNPDTWNNDTSAYIDKEGAKKQLGIWSFSGYSQLYPSKNVKANEYPSTLVWQSGEDTWQKVNLETGISSTYNGLSEKEIKGFTGLSKTKLDKIRAEQPPTPNLPSTLAVTKTQSKAPKNKKFNIVGNNGRQWVAGVTKGDIRFRLATRKK